MFAMLARDVAREEADTSEWVSRESLLGRCRGLLTEDQVDSVIADSDRSSMKEDGAQVSSDPLEAVKVDYRQIKIKLGCGVFKNDLQTKSNSPRYRYSQSLLRASQLMTGCTKAWEERYCVLIWYVAHSQWGRQRLGWLWSQLRTPWSGLRASWNLPWSLLVSVRPDAQVQRRVFCQTLFAQLMWTWST